jgi:two-component system chemotaxis response regulator CheY
MSMRALIVDDSRAMRAIIAKILRELGAEIVEAGNGREGLERLAAGGAVDVVLVDWNMPVMDGLSFVREVRARKEYDGVPLLMVTTESDAHHVTSALDAGANEYVMKPFDRVALLSKLEAVGLTSGVAAG